jgi:hypothetical protein
MEVITTVVARDQLNRIWPRIFEGIEIYRQKSPHYVGEADEILSFLQSEEGDELLVLTVDGEYGGFVTFKVQELEGEVWGTMAMIFLTKIAQDRNALPAVVKQLEAVLRSRGCTIMNYMTARKGFKRLAPTLGFRPRIIEWMKEI